MATIPDGYNLTASLQTKYFTVRVKNVITCQCNNVSGSKTGWCTNLNELPVSEQKPRVGCLTN